MSIVTKFLILISFYFVLVQCEIPNLNVRKLDHQMIAKRRQDTLDMCRIFTEESAKIQQTKPKIINSYQYIQRKPNTRYKREANIQPLESDFSGIPGRIREYDNLKLQDARRYKREINSVANADLINNNINAKNINIGVVGVETKKDNKNNLTVNSHLKTEDIRRTESAATPNPVNPALSHQDIVKIENIVEKIYNDMGPVDKVSFRRNPLVTATTTTQEPKNASKSAPSRRLYFAPAVLKGPSADYEVQKFKPIKGNIYEPARWKHGIIPYFIDSKTYDAQLQEIIIKAFDYIEKATCIRLQKLRDRPTDMKSLQEVHWVYITNPAGVRQCVHTNEKRKIDGVQMSVLGYDCMSLGDIVHEVMHILGFSHEHTRSDRDQYISVLWDNIKPGYKKYFEISKGAEQYSLGNLPYDYASILHYPPRAFSKNGQVTIHTESGIKIGQREGLSEIDLEKIGAIFSSECIERNKDYLLMTCPSVVKSEPKPVNVSQLDIEDYFKDRLWPYGLISYKLREMEFSTEERENIKAVIDHIEKETCIQFRDVATVEQNDIEEPTMNNSNSYQDATKEEHHYDPAVEPPNIVAVEPNDDDNEIEGDERLRKGNTTKVVDTTAAPNISTPGATKRFKRQAGRVNRQTKQDKRVKRVRRLARPPPKAGRRHASNVLILTRSAVPGCKCPKPGKPNGNSVLEINGDCFNSVNDLLHLFVHVLGLDHQHNMYDRDNYLHIVWDNLSSDIRKDLKKKLPPAAAVGFPYDYQSVMHYPWLQIKNGVSNMMYPIWNDGWAMGHWQGLSSFDVQKLNLLYFSECSERQKQSQK